MLQQWLEEPLDPIETCDNKLSRIRPPIAFVRPSINRDMINNLSSALDLLPQQETYVQIFIDDLT